MEFDVDRAVNAIDEIEGQEVRKGAVWQLLFTVESDDEAIRLGRDYGFARAAVLALRENRGRMHGPGLISADSFAPASDLNHIPERSVFVPLQQIRTLTQSDRINPREEMHHGRSSKHA